MSSSPPKSRKGRKSCHNPKKRELTDALRLESDVDEMEFELNVGIKKMASRLHRMNQSF